MQGHTGQALAAQDLKEAMSLISSDRLPETGRHATSKEAVSGIAASGLIPGGPRRTGKLTHLSPFPPGSKDYLSGMTKEAPVLVELDMVLASKCCKFYFTERTATCTSDTIPANCVVNITVIATKAVLYSRAATTDKAGAPNKMPAATLAPTSKASAPAPRVSSTPVQTSPAIHPTRVAEMQRALSNALPAAKPGTATYSRLATTPELQQKADEDQAPKRPRIEDEAPASTDSEVVVATAAFEPDDNMSDTAAADGNVEPQSGDDDAEKLASSDEENVNYRRPVPEEESIKEGELVCSCGNHYTDGQLICVACNKALGEQPVSKVTAAEQQQLSRQAIRKALGNEMQEGTDFEVVVRALKRAPFSSRAALLRKAIKDYDHGAIQGKKDEFDVVRTYLNYEDRFQNDRRFRESMLNCKPPRDLNFRGFVESLERVEKSRGQWQNDYIQARSADAKGKGKGKAGGNAQLDSKGKGKGKEQQKGKDQGSRDRAPSISRNRWTAGSSSGSSSAGAWTAAAWTSNQWWSASGSAMTTSSHQIQKVAEQTDS